MLQRHYPVVQARINSLRLFLRPHPCSSLYPFNPASLCPFTFFCHEYFLSKSCACGSLPLVLLLEYSSYCSKPINSYPIPTKQVHQNQSLANSKLKTIAYVTVVFRYLTFRVQSSTPSSY